MTTTVRHYAEEWKPASLSQVCPKCAPKGINAPSEMRKHREEQTGRYIGSEFRCLICEHHWVTPMLAEFGFEP